MLSGAIGLFPSLTEGSDAGAIGGGYDVDGSSSMVWLIGWVTLRGLIRWSSGSYKFSDTVTPFGKWPLCSCSLDLNLSFIGEMMPLWLLLVLNRLSNDSRLALARDRRRTVSILMLPMLFASSSRLWLLSAEVLRAYPDRK